MPQHHERAPERCHLRRLAPGPKPDDAICVIAGQRLPFALESTAPDHRHGRFTFLGFDPIDTIEIHDVDAGWIDTLARRLGPPIVNTTPTGLPFVGGWVGFITYEAGSALENVRCTKPRDISLPLVWFALYDTVAIYDHRLGQWTLAAVDCPQSDCRRPRPHDRLRRFEALLLNAPPASPIDWSRDIADEPNPVMPRPDYLRRIETAKRHIEAGDIYQVNLTQRLTADCRAAPLDIYRRLRIANPAPLGAYLDLGRSAVISASPELFLDLRDRHIITRPIKGTRPRTGDEILDAARSGDLLASEKDRAELNMIIDLERNDLGRVSEFGSVRVLSTGELETHPTVFHRVATVEGRLRGELAWPDLLRASFPGGSITGTPKIRAMQIIDDLEVTRRSVYCGSIGYIGLDGSLSFNIAIRTMIQERGRIHLFGGGAIVADSDPEDEYEESLAKVAGLMRSLRARREAATTEAM